MGQKVEAPWTPEQVRNLVDWQASSWVQPVTGIDKEKLVPTAEGWRQTAEGPVVQGWAYDFMLDGSVLWVVKYGF